ncbi:uncharacterized protein LOC132548935 [Ylistrum balloti]|uniref:uncharacterized protein LOC132548935 n=1 Tax=Ylistrum balloti TaxID=509963 RepID=UPI002905BD6E|nr:uncharacterized protein LOC132548935 [Ylistrum balloti]
MAYLKITHESLARIDVEINGIPGHFFDRTNNLSVWSIVELFLTGTHPPNVYKFTSKQDLFKNRQLLLFVVQMSCSVTPKIHLISKYSKPAAKIVMSTSVYHLGTSSYSYLTSMTDGVTKEQLGDFFIKFVVVDKTTRKSCPMPTWFTDKFRNVPLHNSNFPYTLPSVPEMPKVIYDTTVTVRYSDMDRNLHVTTHRYIQFFTDCATAAAFSGFYKHFNTDMCWYPVEKFDITLMGESKVGDKLRICTWQDEDSVQTIYFICFKEHKSVMKAVCVYGLNRIAPKLPSFEL